MDKHNLYYRNLYGRKLLSQTRVNYELEIIKLISSDPTLLEKLSVATEYSPELILDILDSKIEVNITILDELLNEAIQLSNKDIKTYGYKKNC